MKCRPIDDEGERLRPHHRRSDGGVVAAPWLTDRERSVSAIPALPGRVLRTGGAEGGARPPLASAGTARFCLSAISRSMSGPRAASSQLSVMISMLGSSTRDANPMLMAVSCLSPVSTHSLMPAWQTRQRPAADERDAVSAKVRAPWGPPSAA